MAPIKRKGGLDTGLSSHTSKGQALTAEERIPKRRKKSQDAEVSKPPIAQRRTAGQSPKAGNQTSTLSALGNEEPSFPRGGASILTPLEHKQIQLEATRDVLFEQQSFKKTELGLDDEREDSSKKSKVKRQPKATGKKAKITATTEEPVIRTEGLSYKRVVPGSIILGQVSQINSHDVALALPNNLTGYVPLTSISDRLTERFEALVGEVDEESDKDRPTEEEDIDLNSCFTLGQYLRAYVTSTGDGAGTKTKKRIELSLNPRQANSGLKKFDLVTNSVVQAS
ncbi:MAG: rRNA biogenesis protein rrp5, partial [Pleopsidium flavum]